jgi:putative transposase
LIYVSFMGTQSEDAFGVYQRCIPSGVVEFLQKQAHLKVRRSIYTISVVLWLMIWQRLQPRGTLATAVEGLLAGAADGLLSHCERAQQKRISRCTGGYSQARQKLPKLLCQQVASELVTQLREILHPGGEPRFYLLDGSSLELENNTSLRKAYPPAENQHGGAHWPVLRIVVLHELETGLAEEPQWGPMYGAAAVSEQALAEKAMDGLEPGSVLVGDRNFGVFSIAWAAHHRGLGVVTRLTEARARKLAGGSIGEEGERVARWEASRFDGRRHGGMPAGASVPGRLIAARVGRGRSKQWLYLFTTLTATWPDVVALYGQRWKIETDLRSLKRTVRLHHIEARQESMMEKELRMAVAAYNLVRAVMALAARRHGLAPRQLSFTFVLDVLNAAWPRLQSAPDAKTYQREVDRLLETAAQGTHPKRPGRSFPRAVWHRRHTFPARKQKPAI